ncbi:MAG TPA: hypothetical protein VEO53_12120 [Candidatus Binatia bacterium]|nr:hypothetical protein [Candidatus Binatia bacterium]
MTSNRLVAEVSQILSSKLAIISYGRAAFLAWLGERKADQKVETRWTTREF